MNNIEEIKPKVKSTLRLFRLRDTIQLNSSGQSAEIADPTGSIGYLLDAMDGNTSVAELQFKVQQKYPTITGDDVVLAIQQMDSYGFLENALFQNGSLLSEYELNRWERNINFFGSFADLQTNKYQLQAELKNARVALLGLGGLGSHLLYDLVAVGIQHIRAVDFDTIVLSNLNRQILYTEADLGRAKTEMAAERILAFNPHLDLEILSMRLGSVEDVLKVIDGCEYVLCVADRPKMELINWVNEACVRQGAILLNGGLDVQRGVYYTMIPGQTGCVACWREQVLQHDALSNELIEERQRLQIGGENAAFVPLVTLVDGLMLSELIRLVTHIAPPVAAGRLMEIRFAAMEMRQAETWERLAQCPVCSGVTARFGTVL